MCKSKNFVVDIVSYKSNILNLIVLQNISHGTIPYLGTFLTDLTMIDTAIPDTVYDGLINFDKRRKEFEVLAQVCNWFYIFVLEQNNL